MDFDVSRELFVFKSNNLFDLDIICRVCNKVGLNIMHNNFPRPI